MTERALPAAALLLATAAMVTVPVAAAAQAAPTPYQSLPPPQYTAPPPPQYASPPPPQAQYAPAPQGQYAPPQQAQTAPTAENSADYNNWLYRQALRDYRARYGQWYAQNQATQGGPARESCENQRNSNVAAGAIFGAAAGALLGASLAGWAVRGAWALFGGGVGLTAGAMLGASSTPTACEHQYAAEAPRPRYYQSDEGYRPPAYAPPPRGGYYERGYDRGYEQRYYRPPPRYYRPPAYPGYGPPPGPYYYDRY
jgi:hypothetical protein